MKLGLCQMPVTASKTENDTVMRRYVHDAAAAGCDLVVLPEMWCCPYSNAAFAEYAEPQGGETWRLLRDTARACGVWLVAGSVPERDGDAIYNTCYVFDPQGTQRAALRRGTRRRAMFPMRTRSCATRGGVCRRRRRRNQSC